MGAAELAERLDEPPAEFEGDILIAAGRVVQVVMEALPHMGHSIRDVLDYRNLRAKEARVRAGLGQERGGRG